jgi:hypothetical protein
MLPVIIFSVCSFVVGYLVGANNPLASVKAKIIAAAKTEVGKI